MKIVVWIEMVANVDETLGELYLQEKQPTDAELKVSHLRSIYFKFLSTLPIFKLKFYFATINELNRDLKGSDPSRDNEKGLRARLRGFCLEEQGSPTSAGRRHRLLAEPARTRQLCT